MWLGVSKASDPRFQVRQRHWFHPATKIYLCSACAAVAGHLSVSCYDFIQVNIPAWCILQNHLVPIL